MSKTVWCLVVTGAIVCSALPLLAQTSTGSILGSVTDQSAAAIPGATVTVSNKATGSARILTSNAEGLYSAPALQAGDYELRVEMQGFRTTVRDAQVLAGSDTTA